MMRSFGGWIARTRRIRLLVLISLVALNASIPLDARAQDVLIPMDERQADHLKAYGAAYWAVAQGYTVDWLLNYRGGAFLTQASDELRQELAIRGVSFENIDAGRSATIVAEVESESSNTAVVRLETAPKIAVYAPDQTLPWDDAVLLALTYAEVEYDMIYDDDVMGGRLGDYDWVHLHHEDFTGQYGKFIQYQNMPWYIEQQREAEAAARAYGFRKVSDLKLAVAETIADYVEGGGFLFAMCSGTETLDIALAAHDTDIVPAEYDGDSVDPDAASRLDFSRTFAFHNFTPVLNPHEYAHSDIDAGLPPEPIRNPLLDHFTLFEFSAKWDPVPTMLTQNHVSTIKGFVGQTTSFRRDVVKPSVVVMAEAPGRDEIRYLYGTYGEGTFAFYSGHDPEDYQHFVGDPPTDLELHKNSPGYRLILNNILFPAARKKEQKT